MGQNDKTAVPIVPLNDLIDEPIHYITMDVEGFEMDIIHGAKR